MSTIADIFHRAAELRGWITDEDTPPDVVAEKEAEKRLWNDVMQQLHEPFEILSEAIDQGLEHAGICLEILPRSKNQTKSKSTPSTGGGNEVDVEAKAGSCTPGESEFSNEIRRKIEHFHSRKGEILRMWAKEKGLTLGDEEDEKDTRSLEQQERDQAQLYLLLYMERLVRLAYYLVREKRPGTAANLGLVDTTGRCTPRARRFASWSPLRTARWWTEPCSATVFTYPQALRCTNGCVICLRPRTRQRRTLAPT